MTPALRQTHRMVWFVLPWLLAGAFWLALNGRPSAFPQEQLYQAPPPALAQVLRTTKQEAFTLQLRTDGHNQGQLEVLIHQPLLLAQPVVYWQDPNSQQKRLLGPLGTLGVYRFPLVGTPPDWTQLDLEIADAVKQEVFWKGTL